MRHRAALALVCALSACVVETDIVARVPSERPGGQPSRDAGAGLARKDGGPPLDEPVDSIPFEEEPDAAGMTIIETDAAVPYDPLRCADDARHLMMIDKGGALSRVRADSMAIEQLGTPDCLTRGVVGAALDQQGVLWVSTQDGQLWWIRPGTKQCESSELEAKVGALTFVYDRESNRELLYFVDLAGKLVMLEPDQLAQTPLGAIKGSLLVGTGNEGDLLALGELGDTALSLDLVRLSDAVTTPMWKIVHKVDQTLRGAAGWRGEIALLLNSDLYSFQRETAALSLLPTDRAPVGTFVVLASSVCGASSK